MLDIVQLRKDLDGVVARLQTRKQPQPYLDVPAYQALESERKALQTRTEELQSQRNTLYRQANQIIAQDVAEIFISHGLAIELHSPKVRGYVNIADTIMRFAGVWKVS